MAIVVDTVPAADPITPPQQATENAEKGPSSPMDVNAQDGERSIRRRSVRVSGNSNETRNLHQRYSRQDRCFTIHTRKGIPAGFIFPAIQPLALELVKWSDVEKTAELLYLFCKELRSADIEELIRKV
jgi:putative aminopeptidase FrvX